MNTNNDNTDKILDFNEESKLAVVFYLSIIYLSIGRKMEVKDTNLVIELKDKSKPITMQTTLNRIDLAAKLLKECGTSKGDNIYTNLLDEFVSILLATPSHTINDFINMAVELIDDIGYKDLFLKYLIAHWQGAKTDSEKQYQELRHSLMENALRCKIAPNELEIEGDSAETELQIKAEFEDKSTLCNNLIDYCSKQIEESKADNNYSIIVPVPGIGRISIGKETSSETEPPETSSKQEKTTFIDILKANPKLKQCLEKAIAEGYVKKQTDCYKWTSPKTHLAVFAEVLFDNGCTKTKYADIETFFGVKRLPQQREKAFNQKNYYAIKEKFERLICSK